MQVQYIWNISLEHQKVGEMFIVCGVLYAIDSVTDRNSKIRFALDLYTNKLLDVNLGFTNPFRKTTMVGYNHKNKVSTKQKQFVRINLSNVYRNCIRGIKEINLRILYVITR